MTSQTLAVVKSPASILRAPAVVAHLNAAPRRNPSRVLVITSNPDWIDQVGLVADGDVELRFQTPNHLEGNSLAHSVELIDLVVFIGSAAKAKELAWSSIQAQGKPLLWLPPPSQASEAPTARPPEAWRREAALAVSTALRHTASLAVGLAAQEDCSEAPSLDPCAGELRQGDCRVRVTPTECNLLRVLLASRGHWIPAAELKLRAFGPDHACHDSLIRVHVYKLRRKLSATNAQIRSAKGRGYMLA